MTTPKSTTPAATSTTPAVVPSRSFHQGGVGSTAVARTTAPAPVVTLAPPPVLPSANVGSMPQLHVLIPFARCVVYTPLAKVEGEKSGFDLAVEQNFQEIYEVGPKGLMVHHRLRPGKDGKPRYVRLKAQGIPGLANPAVQADPAIDFLPEGRVPHRLFKQVIAFFKAVSQKHKSDLEAMIWVMWNKDEGYFLHVPDQQISKAAVRYDWSSVPANSSIIVDIH